MIYKKKKDGRPLLDVGILTTAQCREPLRRDVLEGCENPAEWFVSAMVVRDSEDDARSVVAPACWFHLHQVSIRMERDSYNHSVSLTRVSRESVRVGGIKPTE